MLLRETVREFARREVLPYLDRWEREGRVPRELHKKAADAGILGVAFPEEYGGGGGDLLASMLVTEELILGGASSGLCAALFTHGIATPHIIAAGDRAQIERWVIPALRGELIGSLAVSEPDAGSDVARIHTHAVRQGDTYRLNGAKTFITSGTRADFVTVAARTGGDGYQGISLLVVERGMPGFSVSKELEKMGWWCSDTAELAFQDVEVPATNLVGEEGTGFYQLMRGFQTERLGLAVHAYAVAGRCLELTVAYAAERQTFGRPLTSRQVIRHKLAEMARRVDVSRTYALRIAERHLAGEDVVKEVAMAKNQAIEACDYVVDQAVQIHGGAGYLRGEVERHYRDARILGIGGGSSEIMNEIIAARMGLDPSRPRSQA
ncbi:MAG TPA: acyl-CoA dehydrogenase family protein [Candidatus Dormibacteraeota bacterium]